jgi:tetratricopeptide (TPR) repeat protein
MSKRQYDRALKDYDEAVRLEPDNGLFVRNRANALRIVGQYDRAIAEFRKALTLNVGDAMKRQIETALKELGAAG